MGGSIAEQKPSFINGFRCGVHRMQKQPIGIKEPPYIREAAEQLRRSARKGVLGLFSAEERERLAKLREYERRLRDHEQASRNNPMPDNGARRVGRPSVSRPPHSPTPQNGVPGYEM